MDQQSDPVLAGFIARCGWPVVLFGPDGAVAAASVTAAGIAAGAGVAIGLFEEAARAAGYTVTVTEFGGGNRTVAADWPRAGVLGVTLDAFIEACPLSLAVLDPRGRVLRWNTAAERMYGYSFEDVRGRVLPVVPEADRGWMLENVSSVMSGGHLRGIALRRLHKDGTLMELRMSAAPVRNEAGEIACVVAVYEDLTTLNRTVRELERSQAYLQHAQQLASMGSWTLNLTDETLTWSPEVHRIHGTDPAAFHPTRPGFRKLVHPDDLPSVIAAVERAQQTGEPYAVDHRVVRPDGEIRYCRLSAEPVKDASGRVVKLFGIVQDVTSYIQLKDQFLQAQKLETVGRLAGGVAHDFNNLLTVINGHSELLLLRTPRESGTRDSLQAIHDAGLRAASLTRQLLTLGRKQPAEPRRIDLNQVIDEGGRVIRRLIGEDIELEIDASLQALHLTADPGQLHQVILNLVVNAREAMPGGGRLRISSRRLDGLPAEYGEAEPGQGGSWAELTVADTGHGMDDIVRKRVFEPFFSTKGNARHSGLGLSTVYGIVEQHGGRIRIQSQTGRGTIMSAAFPLDDAPLTEAPAAEPRRAPAPGARIIVVEDQPAVRAVVHSMLESLGYSVEEFASPEAALARIGDGTGLELLISDLVMPGMGGREVVRRARAIVPDLPVLLMSGYAEPEHEPDTGSPAPTGFLAKPFHPNELAARVAKLLSGR
ncbi:MAG: hybrid sensor histidine kinase/response regulator [Candidatus Solibacter sp.]|nr:hybrid sensor histidine kinase/response regulator [Candidatus Solibacter sp.]